MKPTPRPLGAAIRRVRHEKNLTLVQLAAKIGTSHGPISCIERGRTNPSIPMLEAIASALEVSPSVFWEEPLQPGQTPEWESFGAAVKARRDALQIKQATLAKTLDVAQGFVSEIETGLKRPSLETFVALCRALHASPSELLGFGGGSDPSEHTLVEDVPSRNWLAGDRLYIQITETLKAGDIAAFQVDGVTDVGIVSPHPAGGGGLWIFSLRDGARSWCLSSTQVLGVVTDWRRRLPSSDRITNTP